MLVSMMVAVGPDGLIGVDGRLPWRIPEDLKRFKKMTEGKAVIIGRGTWESLPKRPLPNRNNIVLSSEYKSVYTPPSLEPFNTYQVDSLERALEIAEWTRKGYDEVVIIGGAAVYEAAWPLVKRVYLTSVKPHVTPISGNHQVFLDMEKISFSPFQWHTVDCQNFDDHLYREIEKIDLGTSEDHLPI